MAIIGALFESQGQSRASRFILDILASQLATIQDINEIWKIADPMKALCQVLKNDDKGEPESRLIWVTGKDTIMACYHIGVYSSQELIGQGRQATKNSTQLYDGNTVACTNEAKKERKKQRQLASGATTFFHNLFDKIFMLPA